VASLDSDEAISRGLEALGAIFGEDLRNNTAANLANPQTRETVAHLIGEIWTRPQFSIRDRRLLALGVNATLGDALTIKALLVGALLNNEMTETEIEELPLFLSFYVGWGRARHLNEGVRLARDEVARIRACQAESGAKKTDKST
jgi:4-carboxymuconolactone decarboxylase